MAAVAEISALVVGVLNAAAGGLGAWRWWVVAPSRAFWIVLRAAQAAAVLQAGVAGVLAALGFDPGDGLYWLYALLPVAVSFVAEQLRAVSAQTVLDARGLESADAVGELDEAGQRSVVLAVLRREMGIMTLGAIVVVFLALRALGTV
jgi:hypothetical protein